MNNNDNSPTAIGLAAFNFANDYLVGTNDEAKDFATYVIDVVLEDLRNDDSDRSYNFRSLYDSYLTTLV